MLALKALRVNYYHNTCASMNPSRNASFGASTNMWANTVATVQANTFMITNNSTRIIPTIKWHNKHVPHVGSLHVGWPAIPCSTRLIPHLGAHPLPTSSTLAQASDAPLRLHLPRRGHAAGCRAVTTVGGDHEWQLLLELPEATQPECGRALVPIPQPVQGCLTILCRSTEHSEHEGQRTTNELSGPDQARQ